MELKPCPFCGTAAKIQGESQWTKSTMVFCDSDGCPAAPAVEKSDREEAIAGWNTRF